MSASTLRTVVRRSRDGAVWKLSHARLVLSQAVHRRRNLHAGFSDRDHLLAAAGWLERAQDACGDGGVSGRYLLRGGWRSSYPETTGYIVPTFLRLEKTIGAGTFRDRARRAVEFLLKVQLENGAFPGGQIGENTTEPSVFNTAQILSGLLAWSETTGDARAMNAALRAGDWLVSVQDGDGAWRRHVYHGIATAYAAHASCWLAALGRHADRPDFLAAADKHLDWVLRQQDPSTGWFDLAGFSEDDHRARRAVTHTIAYTVWGVLRSAETLGRADGVAAARRAAEAMARRLEISRRLPSVLGSDWRPDNRSSCLTGNAQMALVWIRLFELEGDGRLLNAAFKALDLVKTAQPMSSRNPGIRGGIPGSDPVWGPYLYMALPNWSAKFFIDALLAKERVLELLRERKPARWSPPRNIPREIPRPSFAAGRPISVVLYTTEGTKKVPRVLEDASLAGFTPDLVVFEHPAKAPFVRRLARRVAESGVLSLLDQVAERTRGIAKARRGRHVGGGAPAGRLDGIEGVAAGTVPDPREYCRARGIPVLDVASMNDPATIAALERLAPDLALNLGAGILRAPVLGVPRLGTLNAHMGILPLYRGMNVAEWARFNGDAVGCTVHLVDEGIDTGPILCVRPLDILEELTTKQARDIVDRAQLALLAEVLLFAIRTGSLPPPRPQSRDEGRQYFRMHPEIAATLRGERRKSPRPGLLALARTGRTGL